MKLYEVLKEARDTQYGPGDEETWPANSGHPNDPRATAQEDNESFKGQVTWDSSVADAQGNDIPCVVTVDVDAEARDIAVDRAGKPTGFEWEFSKLTPVSVDVEGKKLPFNQFLSAYQHVDNEFYRDIPKHMNYWKEYTAAELDKQFADNLSKYR